MKRPIGRSVIFIVLLVLAIGVSLWQGMVRIPMETPDYGYRLGASSNLGLWWCEGTHKVDRDDQPPNDVRSTVVISAARNEYEPFQLVLRPERRYEAVTVQTSSMQSEAGAIIPAESITINLVGYLDVQVPTEAGTQGSWPDPLPPYRDAFSVESNKNQPVWVTVHVGDDIPAGNYTGLITIKTDAETVDIPVKLRVWNFTLPKETHLRSAFGFSPENVQRYQNLEGSEELGNACELYYESFASHRVCPYTPMRRPEVSFTTDPETGKVVDVTVNFTQFDVDCHHFLDELGFNSFLMPLEGLGWGTYAQKHIGSFGGYDQGTPEYEALFGKYVGEVQNHLEQNGWLEKAYVYWFDEPETKDYPFVAEGMKNLKKFGPKFTRLLTEEPVPELYGNVDVWCPVLPNYNYEKARERQEAGDRVWWYICTIPKAPYVGLFIDHSAIDMRIWSWMSWQYNVQGLLVWETTYWTCPNAFPKEPQNPWTDPMSYASESTGPEPGKAEYWGNGDGRFLYPPNRDVVNDKKKYLEGPVSSIRWEMLREGIEDYEYFHLLRDKIERLKAAGASRLVYQDAEKLLEIPKEIFTDLFTYTKNPQLLYKYREQIALKLEELPG